MRALVHRQLPISTNFVMAKYIQVAVAPPDLEVAIVGAMPLIDVLGYLDLPVVETNSAELFDTVLVHIGFYSDLHGVLFIVLGAAAFADANADGITRPERADPHYLSVVHRSLLTGCSDRIAAGPSRRGLSVD